MFYEWKNFLSNANIRVEKGENFNFPVHLHTSYEFIAVTDGEMEITADGVAYKLKKGESMLVFPNMVHEFKTERNSAHILCIFSGTVVAAFDKAHSAQLPVNPAFTPSEFYVNKLASLDESASTSEVKGLLYSILGEFEKNAKYRKRTQENEELLVKILRFVESEYSTDCTLGTLSSALGYNYVYLSRYFGDRMGISFTEYVNRYRINEACYLIANSDKTFIDVALEAGFDSLRSFNRNFKAQMGQTPGEYRAARTLLSVKAP